MIVIRDLISLRPTLAMSVRAFTPMNGWRGEILRTNAINQDATGMGFHCVVLHFSHEIKSTQRNAPKRKKERARVDLPQPVAPTMPILLPAGAWKVIPCKTSGSSSLSAPPFAI